MSDFQLTYSPMPILSDFDILENRLKKMFPSFFLTSVTTDSVETISTSS
jgi:hypothetical protein